MAIRILFCFLSPYAFVWELSWKGQLRVHINILMGKRSDLSLPQAQQHNVPMLGLWISKSGSWASICCAGGRFLNHRAVLHKPQLLLTQLTSITHTTLPPARDWMLNMTYSILYGNEVIYSPPPHLKQKEGAFRRGHLSDRLSSPGSQYSFSTVPGGSHWLNQPTNTQLSSTYKPYLTQGCPPTGRLF